MPRSEEILGRKLSWTAGDTGLMIIGCPFTTHLVRKARAREIVKKMDSDPQTKEAIDRYYAELPKHGGHQRGEDDVGKLKEYKGELEAEFEKYLAKRPTKPRTWNPKNRTAAHRAWELQYHAWDVKRHGLQTVLKKLEYRIIHGPFFDRLEQSEWLKQRSK